MSPSLPAYLLTEPAPISPLPSTVRLQALYASTSAQRQSNPTGYAANVSWWSSLLEELLRAGEAGDTGDHLLLRVDEALLSRLEWNGGRPKGLGGVAERLSTTSPPILHPLAHFESSLTPLHAQASLTSRFIGRPLWWAFSQLNPFGSTDEAVIKEDTLWARYGKGKQYVHVPLLEQSAAAFTAHIRSHPPTSYSASLFSLASFIETYATVCFPKRKDGKSQSQSQSLPAERARLTQRDMTILVKWLMRDCGVITVDGDVIKVLPDGEAAADHPITEADRGTVTIRATLRKLEQQVESIEHQIQRCHEKAKHHLSLGQKPIALSHLRSKRQLEEVLLKRISSAQQLEGVLRGIDQAKGDIEIMAAYETSTATLKSILSHPSLDLEHVERTTEDLAEVMANQEEVDSAIRLGGDIAVGASGQAEGVDEEELRKELEEMVKHEREEQARVQEEKRVTEEKQKPEDVTSRQPESKAPNPDPAPPAKPANTGTDTDTDRRQRYEDAQQRQRDEAARAELERIRKAERVAAE